MSALFKFVMTLALAWVAVSALNVDMSPEPNELANTHGCYWDGSAPLCKGECREGWSRNATDRCGDSKCCLTGSKAYCCPPFETPTDCYWDGTAPFCSGACSRVGYANVMVDNCGDGKCCATGQKALCCRK